MPRPVLFRFVATGGQFRWSETLTVGGTDLFGTGEQQGGMDSYKTLATDVNDGVIRIAINRPEELNVVNRTCHRELARVFNDAYETDARVVVLTGVGDAFSAGGDLQWMKASADDPMGFQETLREGEEIIQSLVNLEKPIVARVNGDAIGLGATLALFCDIVIASEDARIGDPHVKAALAAGDGGAVIWPLLTSLNTAKEVLMTGELLTAERASDIGLVNRVVPPEDLDAEVNKIVDQLADGPQAAIRYTKLALNRWLELATDSILRESLALEGISQQDPDHEEAVDAFLEDREAEFPSGR